LSPQKRRCVFAFVETILICVSLNHRKKKEAEPC